MSRSVRIEERLARGGGAIELLHVPAALFALAARARRVLYDRGWLPTERLDAPVVSIGNISAGGTGKTPMVALIVEALRERGRRVGIVSRGYGARAGQANDEARLLAELLPDVPHVQDADRARGARKLLEQHIDVVVLDDGFQHRRLARDLDLVLVDATRPWGLPGRTPRDAPLLPRGLLRESPAALARAHAVVLTRADQVPTSDLIELRAAIGQLAPGVALAVAVPAPVGLRALDGTLEPVSALRERPVVLLSGIAHPEAFERTAAELGARIVEHRRHPDHHAYTPADLEGLGEHDVLVTAKDAVKLRGIAGALAPRVRVLDVELRIVDGSAVLEALLDALPEARAARERRALHEGLHG